MKFDIDWGEGSTVRGAIGVVAFGVGTLLIYEGKLEAALALLTLASGIKGVVGVVVSDKADAAGPGEGEDR
jgi:hypothetical protein